jgi:hypothetical protein
LDEPVAGAEHWDNELCWTDEDGVPLLGAMADGAELVTAAFHRDAEITESDRRKS